MPPPPPTLPFDLLNGGWSDRWRFVYHLWGLFASQQLDPAADLARLDAELPAASDLPSSARQFLAFLNAARDGAVASVFTFRDILVLGTVPGHPARSLIMQGEEDYHWAVLDSDLSLPDPPLQGYHLDYDSGEPCPFVHAGRCADSVSAGAIQYCLPYTWARGGMAEVRLDVPDVTAEALAAQLGPPVSFDGLTLYYARGILVATCDRPAAFLARSYNVQFLEPAATHALPPVVRAMLDAAHVISEPLARRRTK